MFQGKTVIVTGSGAGIGAEAALQFAEAGAAVVLNSISDSAEQIAETIRKNGGKAHVVFGDVSEEATARRLAEEALEQFGSIDVLVNAAGIVPDGSLETCDTALWDHVMAVNVRSVFLTSKYCIDALKASRGCIVNIASVLAIKGVVNRELYSASKGAVLSFSRGLAAKYISDGVRVNCVSPGTVNSPSLRRRVASMPDPEAAMVQMKTRQPIGDIGKTDDIAAAILFLASDRAAYMTGSNIVMDGGLTM